MDANDESLMSVRGLRVFPECIVHVYDVRLQWDSGTTMLTIFIMFANTQGSGVSHEDRHVHSGDSVFDVDSHQTGFSGRGTRCWRPSWKDSLSTSYAPRFLHNSMYASRAGAMNIETVQFTWQSTTYCRRTGFRE